MDIIDSMDNFIDNIVKFYYKHFILFLIIIMIFILCLFHPLLIIGIFLGMIFMFYIDKILFKRKE